MFVILIYDVEAHRTTKLLKLCRRYLNWVQNSCFEGNLSETQLKQLCSEAKKLMDLQKDSLLIYTLPYGTAMKKQVIGYERNPIDNFL